MFFPYFNNLVRTNQKQCIFHLFGHCRTTVSSSILGLVNKLTLLADTVSSRVVNTWKNVQKIWPMRLLLVQTVIFLHFSYCSPDIMRVLSGKLQHSQSNCIAFVCDLLRNDHILIREIRNFKFYKIDFKQG